MGIQRKLRVDGKRIRKGFRPFSPKREATDLCPVSLLSLLLSHELDNGLSYQVGSRTIGKSYYWDNTGANSDDNIGTYTLIDANIAYAVNDWNLAVFGSNLTDEEYYTSLVSNLGFGNGNAPGVAGSPRVIGLSISREF